MDEVTEFKLPKGWHNHEGYRQIFCAALNGFISNKDFGGAISQSHPKAAVDFAKQVVAICASTAMGEN